MISGKLTTVISEENSLYFFEKIPFHFRRQYEVRLKQENYLHGTDYSAENFGFSSYRRILY